MYLQYYNNAPIASKRSNVPTFRCMAPRSGHQCRQPLHELQRAQHQVRRSVSPLRLEPERHFACRVHLDALLRQCRPRDVAAQADRRFKRPHKVRQGVASPAGEASVKRRGLHDAYGRASHPARAARVPEGRACAGPGSGRSPDRCSRVRRHCARGRSQRCGHRGPRRRPRRRARPARARGRGATRIQRAACTPDARAMHAAHRRRPGPAWPERRAPPGSPPRRTDHVFRRPLVDAGANAPGPEPGRRCILVSTR